MTGIFPQHYDGGIPANPNTPNDPAQAFLHRHQLPIDTDALYYGNGCEVRLRPHVVNSLISEIAAIADRAGVGYRASSLQNAETAIRYLIQRGLPHACMLDQQTPWFFDCTVDPPPPCYTDFLTFTFVPRFLPNVSTNRGFVRINLNGLGYVPLFRHDGTELRQGDILNYKPFMAVYFNGAWYLIGRIPPEYSLGGIDLWVRTDGNDETADGTANSPERAFRTINAAWRSVAERFLATPLFTANIKLGIPGDYEAAYLGPFGSNLTISGGGWDAGGWGGGDRWSYRILSRYYPGEDNWIALAFYGCNSVALHGLTLLIMNGGGPPSARALLVGGRTTLTARNCSFTAQISNTWGYFIDIRDSTCAFDESVAGTSTWFQGNGTTISGAIIVSRGVFGTLLGSTATLVSSNFTCLMAYLSLDTLSSCTFGGDGNNAWGGVVGRQYSAMTNSILYHNLYRPSGPIPGTIPGISGLGAVVVPG